MTIRVDKCVWPWPAYNKKDDANHTAFVDELANRVNSVFKEEKMYRGYTPEEKDDVVFEPPVREDNWVHRNEGMKCHTCMFYVPKAPREEANRNPTMGRCRRHAPTMSGFPVVFLTDWCGDHKLDEEKI